MRIAIAACGRSDAKHARHANYKMPDVWQRHFKKNPRILAIKTTLTTKVTFKVTFDLIKWPSSVECGVQCHGRCLLSHLRRRVKMCRALCGTRARSLVRRSLRSGGVLRQRPALPNHIYKAICIHALPPLINEQRRLCHYAALVSALSCRRRAHLRRHRHLPRHRRKSSGVAAPAVFYTESCD